MYPSWSNGLGYLSISQEAWVQSRVRTLQILIFFHFLDNFFQSAGGKLTDILEQKCKSNYSSECFKHEFKPWKKIFF